MKPLVKTTFLHLEPILQSRSIWKTPPWKSSKLDVNPCNTKVAPILNQCGSVEITAPARDAMFMNDKPDHMRDIAASKQGPRRVIERTHCSALNVLFMFRNHAPSSCDAPSIHKKSTTEDPQSIVERLRGAFTEIHQKLPQKSVINACSIWCGDGFHCTLDSEFLLN